MTEALTPSKFNLMMKILATDHDDIDYNIVYNNARLIVDTAENSNPQIIIRHETIKKSL